MGDSARGSYFESDLTSLPSERGTSDSSNKHLRRRNKIREVTLAQKRKRSSAGYVEGDNLDHFPAQTRHKSEELSSEDELTLGSGDSVTYNLPRIISQKSKRPSKTQRRISRPPTGEPHSDHEERVANASSSFDSLKKLDLPLSHSSEDTIQPSRSVPEHGHYPPNRGGEASYATRGRGRGRRRGRGRGRDSGYLFPAYNPPSQEQIDHEPAVSRASSSKRLRLHSVDEAVSVAPIIPLTLHHNMELDLSPATLATADSVSRIRRRVQQPGHATSSVHPTTHDTRRSINHSPTHTTIPTSRPSRLQTRSSLNRQPHNSFTAQGEDSPSSLSARRHALTRQTRSSTSVVLGSAPCVAPEATSSAFELPTGSSGLKIRLPPRLGKNGVPGGKSVRKGNAWIDELEASHEETEDADEIYLPLPSISPIIPPTPKNTPQPDTRRAVPSLSPPVIQQRAHKKYFSIRAGDGVRNDVVDISAMVPKWDSRPWPPGEAEVVLESSYRLFGLSFTGADSNSAATTSTPNTHADAIRRNGLSSAELGPSGLSNISKDDLESLLKMADFILEGALESRETLERIQNYDLRGLNDKDRLLVWAAQKGFIYTEPPRSVPEESRVLSSDGNPGHSPSSSSSSSTSIILPVFSESNTQSTAVQPLDTVSLSNELDSEDPSGEISPLDISPRKTPRRSPLKIPIGSVPHSLRDLVEVTSPSSTRRASSPCNREQIPSILPLNQRDTHSSMSTAETSPRPLPVPSPTTRATSERFDYGSEYDPEVHDELDSLDHNGYDHASTSSIAAPMLTIAQIRKPLSAYVPPQPSLAIPHGLTIRQASDYIDYLAQAHAEPYLRMREEVAQTVVRPDMSSWAIVRDDLVGVSMGYGKMDERGVDNAVDNTETRSPDSRGESSVASLLLGHSKNSTKSNEEVTEPSSGSLIADRSPLVAHSYGNGQNSGNSSESSPLEPRLSTIPIYISSPAFVPRHIVHANVAAALRARAEIDELRSERAKQQRAWMRQPETGAPFSTSGSDTVVMDTNDEDSAVEIRGKQDGWLFEKTNYILDTLMQRPQLSYHPRPTRKSDSVPSTSQISADPFEPIVTMYSPTTPTLVNADYFENHTLSHKASLIKGPLLSRSSPPSKRQLCLLSNPVVAYPARELRVAGTPSGQHPGPSYVTVLPVTDGSGTSSLTVLSTSSPPQPASSPLSPNKPKKYPAPKRRFSHVEVPHLPSHAERCNHTEWSKILGPPKSSIQRGINDDSDDELVLSSTSPEPAPVIRSSIGTHRKRRREDEDDGEFLPSNESPIKSPSKRMKLENGSFTMKDEVPTAMRRSRRPDIPIGQSIDDIHVSASEVREAVSGVTQLCHNCRNSTTTNLSKAKCGNIQFTDKGDHVRCGKVFCPRCLQVWYGLDDDAITFLVNKKLNSNGEMGTGLGFGIITGEWICPFCCDRCMCTVCAKRRGVERTRLAPSSKAVFRKGYPFIPTIRRRATLTFGPDQEQELNPSQVSVTRRASTPTSSLPAVYTYPRKRMNSLQVSSAWQVIVPTPTPGLAPEFYEATRPRTRDFPTGAPPPTAAHFTPTVVKHGSNLERDGLEDQFTCSEGETGGKESQNGRPKRVDKTGEAEAGSKKERRKNYAVVIPGRKLPSAKKVDIADLTKSNPSSPSVHFSPPVSSPGLLSLPVPHTVDSLIPSLDELAIHDRVIEPEEIHGSSQDRNSTRASSQQPTVAHNPLSTFSLDIIPAIGMVVHPFLANSFFNASAGGASTTPIQSVQVRSPPFPSGSLGEAPWRNRYTGQADFSPTPSPNRSPSSHSVGLEDQSEAQGIGQAAEPSDDVVEFENWLAD